MTDSSPAIVIVDRMRPVPGYILGLVTPSTRVVLDLEELTNEGCDRILQRLAPAFDGPDEAEFKLPLPADDSHEARARWLGALVDAFHRRANMAFTDTCRAMQLRDRRVALFVPTFDRGGAAVAAMIDLIVALSAFDGASGGDDAVARVQQVLTALSNSQPHSSNGPRIARAAFDLGYPFRQLPGLATQIGIGRNAARIESTMTAQTSYTATRYAKLKHWTSAMLAEALIPTPRFGIVRSADEAVTVAERFGYPVVVKPADKDGGQAVEAGLSSPEAVRAAYEGASAVSNLTMVESHIQGRDYRLTVFRDKMVRAIERRPAGVEGDGASSVFELVEKVNRDPARGEGTHARLNTLRLDDAALAVLAEQEMTPETVPFLGRFVRLSRRSNVTAGGTPIAVTETVHPDNADLAVRAAQRLQLNLAGIDLIVPDISRSWRETGGAVIEVNAEPELGGTTSLHLYPWLLQQLVAEDGKVPTLAVLGGKAAAGLAADISNHLGRDGAASGLALRQGVAVGGHWLAQQPLPLFIAGRALAGNGDVASIVLELWDRRLSQSGLPVPAIDVLFLTGEAPLNDDGSPMDVTGQTAMLVAIAPHCHSIRILDEDDADPTLKDIVGRLPKTPIPTSREQLLELVRQLSEKIEAR